MSAIREPYPARREVREADLTVNELSAFYRRTVNDVYRYASQLSGNDRSVTEELVQDTYLHLLRRVGSGPIDVDLGWLIVTCRHRHIDRLRAERRRSRRENRVAREPQPATSERAPAIEALASLPPSQRTAMVLHYVDDLPVSAVAREMGRSVRAVESLLARGRRALREVLVTSNGVAGNGLQSSKEMN
jgi:RNA polymerase sigma-70 factor, ECF subfamily